MISTINKISSTDKLSTKDLRKAVKMLKRHESRWVSLYWFKKIFEFNKWGFCLTLKRRRTYSDTSGRMLSISRGLSLGKIGSIFGVKIFESTYGTKYLKPMNSGKGTS